MHLAALVAAAALALAASAAAEDTCPKPGIPKFSCPKLPTPPPAANVTSLRPGNVAAIMCVGDSITAAALAYGLEPLEFRGLSYACGGDSPEELGSHTVHNFLKHYNPKIEGGCTGTTIPFTRDGKGLNTAISGAIIQDVPDQLDRMIELLNGKYKHIKDDWKILNVFIGANNLCGSCKLTRQEDTPETWEKELRIVLDKVQAEIPKTFVNVLTIFNISQVWIDSLGSKYCETVVPIFHECDCLDANATHRLLMDEQTQKYNAITFRVVEEYAAKKDPNFTAVVQPGSMDEYFANWGERYLSNLDCFHPSLCSHQGFAVNLWNNMAQPVGKKSTGKGIDPQNPPEPHCWTEDEFIQ